MVWDKILAGADKLLDIGGNLIGEKYGSDLQGHENDRMRQYNLDMAREFWAKNVAQRQHDVDQERTHNQILWTQEKEYAADLWNKQNEYNSPKAQMQRMADAGLNPNLFYDQGTSGISTVVRAGAPEGGSSPSVRAEAPDYGEPVDRQRGIAGVLDRYTSMRKTDVMAQNMRAQKDLIKAQKDAVDAGADRTREETRGIRHDNDLAIRSGFPRKDPWYVRGAGRYKDKFKGDLDIIAEADMGEIFNHLGGVAKKHLRNKATGIKSSIMDWLGKIPMFKR